MQIKITTFPLGPQQAPQRGHGRVVFTVESTNPDGATKRQDVIVRNKEAQGFTVEPRRYEHRFIDSFRLFTDALQAAEETMLALVIDATHPWRYDVWQKLDPGTNEAYPYERTETDGTGTPD